MIKHRQMKNRVTFNDGKDIITEYYILLRVQP